MANKVLPEIILEGLKDDVARENFFRLQKFHQKFPLFRGEFEFREFVIPAAGTNLKIAHGLKFAPRDIISMSTIGSGVLTWNYERFDRTNLDITTTGPCTVRCFIGAYREEM